MPRIFLAALLCMVLLSCATAPKTVVLRALPYPPQVQYSIWIHPENHPGWWTGASAKIEYWNAGKWVADYWISPLPGPVHATAFAMYNAPGDRSHVNVYTRSGAILLSTDFTWTQRDATMQR